MINSSLIGWVFGSFYSLGFYKLVLAIFIVVFIGLAILYLFVKILQEIKKLKDL